MKKHDNTIFFLSSIVVIAVILIGGILAYFIKIFGSNIPDNTEQFARFGDFIGGTLNPILAFLALIALLYTIKIQSDELTETREELKESRIAQQEQSESLKLQNNATKIQMFENTFFRLLSESNSLLDELYEDEDGKAIDNILKQLSENNIYLDKEKLKEEFSSINSGNIKIYFMMLYQVLKFIDNTKLVTDKKSYTNIVRVNLESKVLSLLAVNCYVNNYPKYKEYMEKYSFFEHLDISSDKLFFMVVILLDGYKNKSIYGDNKDLIKELKSYLKE